MKHSAIIAAVAAFLAATAQGVSLLDSVLEEEASKSAETLEVLETPQVFDSPSTTNTTLNVSEPDAGLTEELKNVAFPKEAVSRRELKDDKGHLLRPICLQGQGCGGDGSYVGASLSAPLGWFDIAIKTESASLDFHHYGEAAYDLGESASRRSNGNMDFYWNGNGYGIVLLQFNPARNGPFAPYVGVGGGIASVDIEYDYKGKEHYSYTTRTYSWWGGWQYSYHSGYRTVKRSDEYKESCGVSCVNGGIRWNFRKFSFVCDAMVLFLSDVGTIAEITGDLGFYVSDRTKLHAIVGMEELCAKEFLSGYSDIEDTFDSFFAGVGISYDY